MLQYIIEWIWSNNDAANINRNKKKAVLTIEKHYLRYKSNLRKNDIQSKKINSLAKKIVNITDFRKKNKKNHKKNYSFKK
jgi:hypothetical protein